MTSGSGARTVRGVETLAARAGDLAALDSAVTRCHACPRLVEWREEVAKVKIGRAHV